MKLFSQTKDVIGKSIQPQNFSFLNTLSIRNRLIFVFMLVSILPLIAIGGLSYYISKAAIADKIAKYSIRELVQVTNNLNLDLKEYEDYTYELMSNREVNQTLSEYVNNPAFDLAANIQKIKNIFDNKLILESDVSLLFVSVKNNRKYAAGNSRYISVDAFKKTVDYQQTLNLNGKIHWFYLKGMVGLSRVVNDMVTMEPLGVITLFLDPTKLDKVINYTLYNQSADTSEKVLLRNPYSIIVDNKGVILASPFTDDVGKQLADLVQNPRFMEQLAELGEATDKFTQRVKNIRVLVTANPMASKEWYLLGIAPNSYLYAESTMVGLSTMVLGLILSGLVVVISIMVALGISEPLQQVMQAMKQAENGNLAVKVDLKTQDELGQLASSFNLMMSRIKRLVMDAQEVVVEVLNHSKVLEDSSVLSAQTAESVAAASEQISRGAQQQTGESEKTSRKMEKLAKQIETVVEKSAEMQQLTDLARTLSLNSNEVVEELIVKADKTGQITNSIIDDIQQLASQAREIKNITSIISNITTQSNLLALNASIEAARAGEAGHGFAVVAEEMNKLASRSANAAQMINTILQRIQTKTVESAQIASQGYQFVEEQVASVERAQQAFSKITQTAEHIAIRIADISEYIRVIDTVKTEALSSIMNISSVSEETAASSEEVTASTEEQRTNAKQLMVLAHQLTTLADKLVNHISRFSV